MKKLKILINSNAPWSSSGYANQLADFAPLIKQEGYDIRIIAFYGLQGGEVEWKGIPCLPAIDDVWGADAMLLHGVDFKPDITMTLQDIFVLDAQKLQQLERYVPIVPIDHEPTPKAVLDRLKLAYRIITYSKFGHDQLKKEGLHSTFIPHTVNTEIFQKLDKKECREIISTWCKKPVPENAFVFGMIAANKENPPRKSFQEVLDAFKMFLEKVNPNSILYLHTNLRDLNAGFPIMAYAQTLGIHENIRMTEDFIMRFKLKKEQMPILYNSFDVLLEPSTYEGFGIPPFEAQACEVPVIVHDYTALRDACIDGKTGFKVKSLSKRFTGVGAYAAQPDTQDLFEKMKEMHSTNRVKMGKRGRTFIKENYDLKLVWERHWKPWLQKVENEIYKDR